MHDKKDGLGHPKALVGVLLCMCLWFLCYHSLAGGTLLQPNAFDSYLLQTQNWLAGSVQIKDGGNYPWLELATYQGQYYLSFPPVPSVLLIPWALVFGATVPANFVISLYSIATAIGVYWWFKQLQNTPQECAFWTLLVVMGSNFLDISSDGGVWLQAQVLNLCFAVWGLVCYRAGRKAAGFALLALAVGCRPFTAFLAVLLFVPAAVRAIRARQFGYLAKISAAPVFIAAVLGWYNWVRFGNPFEFGHRYLPEFLRVANGQFSLAYLVPNLVNLVKPVTLSSTLQLQFPLFNGFCFFVGNPLFAYWFYQIGKQVVRRQVTLHGGVILLVWFANVVALCLHRTMGGWQFGTRYLVDTFPYVMLWQATKKDNDALGAGAWTLCGCGVLFNLYGSVQLLLAERA